MVLAIDRRIGKYAILLAMNGDQEELPVATPPQWKSCMGKVGSMDSQKVVAAIETAAKREGIIKSDGYRETHALYHAIMDALSGVTRGQVQLGSVMRTVGLRFAVVRGNPYEDLEEGDWIAVALYGTIGAPVRGSEHETIGLGINHI
ncbi:MAG: hut operon transcriptional regulator HutP [Bacillota bacterium]|jgi:hut operon positive regulator|uniref:hut operon transcriptional regulator HutP n=1 Tax=Bacillus sp. RO2 TaxID=2723913 RepID=UPI00145F9DFD|nr:hut operon transcriptional regulator HutP [Bacillus sp. RO2]MEA3321835.1 hut operon transcriptional regulator HutP [Bacillota bacterium]NMH73237.1 hut operon transcriptional regulator HutP [Bacillus sp. RO2]